MLIIFGVRGYVRNLAIVTLVCAKCGNPAAHRVFERVRKFTLFFVPLFPVSTDRLVTCTFCAQTTSISKEVADQYVLHMQSERVQTPPAELPIQPPPALQ